MEVKLLREEGRSLTPSVKNGTRKGVLPRLVLVLGRSTLSTCCSGLPLTWAAETDLTKPKIKKKDLDNPGLC